MIRHLLCENTSPSRNYLQHEDPSNKLRDLANEMTNVDLGDGQLVDLRENLALALHMRPRVDRAGNQILNSVVNPMYERVAGKVYVSMNTELLSVFHDDILESQITLGTSKHVSHLHTLMEQDITHRCHNKMLNISSAPITTPSMFSLCNAIPGTMIRPNLIDPNRFQSDDNVGHMFYVRKNQSRAYHDLYTAPLEIQ